MRQVLALFYRHLIVWVRRLPVFLALYIIGPVIMLYGLTKSFNIADGSMSFILPGILVNSVAMAGFISCSYGTIERFQGKYYESWLAAGVSVQQIVFAEGIFQGVKGILTALGVWIAACILNSEWFISGLFASFFPMILVGWTSAMLGYSLAAVSRGYDDISLTEPLMTAIFVFSGVFTATSSFEWPLQVYAMLFPVYHGIEIVRPFFIEQPINLNLVLHLNILLIMTLSSTSLAVVLFKRRLFA